MMFSSLTISAKFFLMASLIFSLWRCWSIGPLRWSDQSCLLTEYRPYLEISDIKLPYHGFRVEPEKTSIMRESNPEYCSSGSPNKRSERITFPCQKMRQEKVIRPV